jgi:hypothetical protein
VFGLNRSNSELAGLIPCEEQHPARVFRVSLEHGTCLK